MPFDVMSFSRNRHSREGRRLESCGLRFHMSHLCCRSSRSHGTNLTEHSLQDDLRLHAPGSPWCWTELPVLSDFRVDYQVSFGFCFSVSLSRKRITYSFRVFASLTSVNESNCDAFVHLSLVLRGHPASCVAISATSVSRSAQH